jgi:hypothetical protein
LRALTDTFERMAKNNVAERIGGRVDAADLARHHDENADSLRTNTN